MAEFKVHAAAHEGHFQHGAAPIGAFDSHEDRFGTELRVAGDQHAAIAVIDHCVAPILRLNLERGPCGQVAKINTAFNFGLGEIMVHAVAEVAMRIKEIAIDIDIARLHIAGTGLSITRRTPAISLAPEASSIKSPAVEPAAIKATEIERR